MITAATVRAKAAQLVRDHAARLGMDAMAAGVLVRAIEAIPVEDHTDVIARRMGAEFVPTIRLTAEDIAAARTPAGGWTKQQLHAWGVPWPPPKGWRKALMEGPAE